jgi:hypothetical protein
MRGDGLARFREILGAFREARLAGVVNLLMFQPLRYVEVLVPLDLIHADVSAKLQLLQPVADELWCVRVVGVQTAREESRGCASPPGIIDECPELDEQEAGITAQLADALALNELRLDGADSRHYRSPSCRLPSAF